MSGKMSYNRGQSFKLKLFSACHCRKDYSAQ
jgi:hypothetical protein